MQKLGEEARTSLRTCTWLESRRMCQVKAGVIFRNLLRSVRILGQGCAKLNISLTVEAQVLNWLLCLLQSTKH